MLVELQCIYSGVQLEGGGGILLCNNPGIYNEFYVFSGATRGGGGILFGNNPGIYTELYAFNKFIRSNRIQFNYFSRLFVFLLILLRVPINIWRGWVQASWSKVDLSNIVTHEFPYVFIGTHCRFLTLCRAFNVQIH